MSLYDGEWDRSGEFPRELWWWVVLVAVLVGGGLLISRNWDGWHRQFHEEHPQFCNPYKGECA